MTFDTLDAAISAGYAPVFASRKDLMTSRLSERFRIFYDYDSNHYYIKGFDEGGRLITCDDGEFFCFGVTVNVDFYNETEKGERRYSRRKMFPPGTWKEAVETLVEVSETRVA